MEAHGEVAERDVAEREAEAARLEAEMAQVCGVLNAATARLVGLIREVLGTEAWQGWGIRSPEQWVAWKCGVSARRARSLVAMARRMGELPQTRDAFAAGELAEDQVSVIVRHAPAATDAEAATLARSATVTQLRRVLGRYVFARPLRPQSPAESVADPDAPEARRVSFGYDDEGSWRLSALLGPDEGALWERALGVAREEAFRDGATTEEAANERDVTWADALVAVAERALAEGATLRVHRDRHLVLWHLGTDAQGRVAAQLHGGPVLAPGLRRYLACDARVRGILETGGKPVSVGRAFRIVPERTRMAVEDRDRGCRVPGCPRNRWLQVHHITHWEDGGATDTANLVALCGRHHRLHHRDQLGISGDADDPDGLVFTDARGRRLTGCGRPAPPGPELGPAVGRLQLQPVTYVHPTGEHLDTRWVHFNEAVAQR